MTNQISKTDFLQFASSGGVEAYDKMIQIKRSNDSYNSWSTPEVQRPEGQLSRILRDICEAIKSIFDSFPSIFDSNPKNEMYDNLEKIPKDFQEIIERSSKYDHSVQYNNKNAFGDLEDQVREKRQELIRKLQLQSNRITPAEKQAYGKLLQEFQVLKGELIWRKAQIFINPS